MFRAKILPGGIGARLYLLIALTLLPVLALLAWIFIQRYEIRRADALATELEVAQGVAATFETYVDDVRRQNFAVGQAIITFATYSQAKATQVLTTAARQYRSVRSMSWVSPEGRVLASSEPAIVGRDLSIRPYIRQVQAGAPWALGDLIPQGIVTKAPMLAIATAIGEERGPLRGIVVAAIEPDRLGELTMTQRRPAGAAYAIFDRQGVVVYQSMQEPLSWEERARWRESDALLRAALASGQPQTGQVRLAAPGGEWLSARAPIAGLGWVAGASRRVESALAPVRRDLLQDSLLALLVFALAFGLAYLLAQTIAGPLRRLKREAQALGAGEVKAEVDLQAPTEVALLRDTVTAMAAGLTQRAEDLRQSEERLRVTFDNAAVGIVETDRQDRFVAVNDRACEILGYSREELLGMSVHDLTAPEDRPSSDRLNAQLHEGQMDRFDYEKRYLRRDGSPLWVHVTVAVVRDAAGRYHHSIGTFEDISRRKAAEEQLRLQAKALEAAANGIVITDASGAIQWVNQAFTQMTGYCAEEAIGHNPRILKSDRHDASLYRALWETIRRGDVWHGELINRRKDGALYPEEMTIAPVLDDSGGISHFIAIKLDITRRRQAEEALRAANAKLAEADRRKDEFMAMLAHELRNPLAPIRNAAQVLRLAGGGPESLRRHHEMIDRQVSHMSRLLDDLLDVSRITRGKIELKRETLDLRDVIERAIESMRSQAGERQQHLNYQIPSAALEVHGDPTRLEQVLRNLLHNAIKYTEPGGCIWLSATAEEEVTQWRAVVRVCDSGTGIAPELLEHIFEPFVQAEQSLARTQGGLGIGLSMVKLLVELHGGRVKAYSGGMGCGSEFVIHLPLLAEESVSPLQQTHEETPGSMAPVPPASRRVLVVDDSADTASSLGDLLALWGYAVHAALDGRQALAAAREWRPEIILLDIGLPDMDGYAVARLLRAEPATAGALIVALTGYGAEEDRQRALEAGFNQHLTKPVELGCLQRVLSSLRAA